MKKKIKSLLGEKTVVSFTVLLDVLAHEKRGTRILDFILRTDGTGTVRAFTQRC